MMILSKVMEYKHLTKPFIGLKVFVYTDRENYAGLFPEDLPASDLCLFRLTYLEMVRYMNGNLSPLFSWVKSVSEVADLFLFDFSNKIEQPVASEVLGFIFGYLKHRAKPILILDPNFDEDWKSSFFIGETNLEDFRLQVGRFL